MADSCCCFVDYSFPIFGLLLIWYGLNRRATAQQILNTPTSKVRSAAVGLVELKGKVVLDKKLVSPVSGRECAYYELGFIQHGDPLFYIPSKKVSSFYLDDGTGKVLVKTEDANLRIHESRTYRGSFDGEDILAQSIRGYVKGLDSSKRSMIGKDIWIREKTISEGDEFYVMGTASPIENAPKDAQAHERLVVHRGLLDRILVVSDRDETDVFKEIRGVAYVYMGIGALLVLVWLGFQIAFAII